MIYMRLLLIISALFMLFSCESNSNKNKQTESTLKEIKRIPSPDKRVDAVQIEDEGNATVANFIQVFIVLPGVKITEDDRRYSLFKADHFSGVNIKWEKQQNLVIEYEKARIFNFCNFWQDAGLDNWNYIVELTLDCTSPDGQLTSPLSH